MNQTGQTKLHPQYWKERGVTNELMSKDVPEDKDLAELARQLIRFNGFPGAHDIQRDLQSLLDKWGYTKESLFDHTRNLHNRPEGFFEIISKRDDWT